MQVVAKASFTVIVFSPELVMKGKFSKFSLYGFECYFFPYLYLGSLLYDIMNASYVNNDDAF